MYCCHQWHRVEGAVYFWLPMSRSVCRLNSCHAPCIPWPGVWLVGTHNAKHRFRGSELPHSSHLTQAIRDTENKLRWRVKLGQNESERHKRVVPCNALQDPEVEQVIRFFPQDLVSIREGIFRCLFFVFAFVKGWRQPTAHPTQSGTWHLTATLPRQKVCSTRPRELHSPFKTAKLAPDQTGDTRKPFEEYTKHLTRCAAPTTPHKIVWRWSLATLAPPATLSETEWDWRLNRRAAAHSLP